ncbi:MAG: hypothetical protein VYC51_10315, partial [Pseudomonadota bacterium]|nr:hypothetical protein [Pseudomonadota bacterium]
QPDISSPAVLNALRALQQQKDTDTVWQTLIENGAPLIEPSSKADEYLLTFLHRGAKHNALIFGAPDRDHGWISCNRLPGSQIQTPPPEKRHP